MESEIRPGLVEIPVDANGPANGPDGNKNCRTPMRPFIVPWRGCKVHVPPYTFQSLGPKAEKFLGTDQQEFRSF